MKKTLVVGTMAFDEIETPFGKTGVILGGSSPYIALGMVPFSQNVGIVSVVGEDFPENYISLLNNKGIDLSGVEKKKGEKTFFWKGKYLDDINIRETLVTELNVLQKFEPIVPKTYNDLDILVLGNLDPNIQNSVLEQIPQKPQIVILDTMNFWIENTWDSLVNVMKKVDVISINDEEARQISNEHSLVKAAKQIHTMGPKTVIIKKGEHGALVFHENEMFVAPALLMENVLDPTGAGDTFIGGLASYLSTQKKQTFETIKMATMYGCATASICVEQFGTDGLAKTNKQVVLERLEKLMKISQINH